MDFDFFVPNEVFAVLEETFVCAAVEVDLLAAVEEAEEFHCVYFRNLKLTLMK